MKRIILIIFLLLASTMQAQSLLMELSGKKASLPIPTPKDALFYLDGTITLVDTNYYFKDKTTNNRDFLITDYDFNSDWTKGFPYKSAATISAPIGDTVLITADVNNYFYAAADSTPNQIPVVSLFQDVDYEHKLFCKHISPIEDSDQIETYQGRVKEITLYNEARVGEELVECQSYYSVPEEDLTAYWVSTDGVDAGGTGTKINPYLHIDYAVSYIDDGKKIYVKTGVGLSATYLNDNRNHEIHGIGLVSLAPSGTSTGLQFSTTSTRINRIVSKPTASATRNLYPKNINAVISDIYLDGVGGGIMSGGFAEFKNSIIEGTFSAGISLAFIPDTTIISGNYFNVNCGGYLLSATASDAVIIKNNKLISTGSLAYFTTPANLLVVGNYLESAGGFTMRNNSGVVFRNNNVKATIYLTYNNNINVALVNNNTFTNVGMDSDCPAKIENNIINSDINIAGFGFILSSANDIDTAIIRNNTFTTSGTGGFIIGSDASNSANNHVLLSLFEKNKMVATGAPHGCLMGYQPNPIARYNYLDVNNGYGFVMENVDGMTEYSSGGIYGNIIKSNFRSIVANVDGLRIYNNTFITNTEEPFTNVGTQGHLAPPINTKIKNNIFISTYVGNTRFFVFDSSLQDIDYNLYYCANGNPIFKINGVDYTFSEWQGLGFDVHSSVLTETQFNGLFTDFANGDYSLVTGSMAIESGVDLGSTYDYGLDSSTNWGSAVPSVVTKQQTGTWDIGAYVQ